jgi:hypothetical protein
MPDDRLACASHFVVNLVKYMNCVDGDHPLAPLIDRFKPRQPKLNRCRTLIRPRPSVL